MIDRNIHRLSEEEFSAKFHNNLLLLNIPHTIPEAPDTRNTLHSCWIFGIKPEGRRGFV
jgi:hypothetical protein